MMSTIAILAAVALIVQLAAIGFWATLYSRIERWVWWIVTVGFLIMATHRIAEGLNYRIMPTFSQFTALLIAFTALIAVLQACGWVRKRDKHAASLIAVERKLDELRKNLTLREHIAVQVAEVITDLRDEITYYEEQALFHKLPTYPRKSGGPDRTRTG